MKPRIALTTALFVCALCTAGAATYYVSPTGNPEDPGTRQQPWNTAKANESLVPGDTAVFLKGRYTAKTDRIQPARNGEPGAPITYRSEAAHAAELRPDVNAIALSKRKHICIEGFLIVPRRGSAFGYLRSTTDCTIENCRMEGPKAPKWGTFVGLKYDDAHRIRFRNNVLRRHILPHDGLLGPSNLMTCYGSSLNLYEGNVFEKSGHELFGFMLRRGVKDVTANNVVRGNIFCNEWGRCVELFIGRRTLFENNVIMGSIDSNGSFSGRSKILGRNGIIRRNVVWRNWDCPFTSDRYREGFVFLDNRVYNNVLYGNYALAWQLRDRMGAPAGVAGNVWKNNVFFSNDVWGGFRAIAVPANVAASGNLWIRNVFCGDRPGRKTICWNTETWATYSGAHYTAEEANTAVPASFQRNLDVDPMFADPARGEFSLRPGSPCIDAGEPLARATRAGSGRELPVDDAGWFYDGAGVPGEQGDIVMIGTNRTTARITEVDLEKHVLRLARDVRWQKDDAVTLPYAGQMPDLGALESGARAGPWHAPIPECAGYGWQPPEDPAAPLMTCGFEDADQEEWGALWNLRRTTKTQYDVDRTTGAAGTACSLRMWAEKDGRRLYTFLTPRMWEIDKYPWVGFWYRLSPGVALGLRLDAFDNVSRQRGELYVAGTAGFEVENRPEIRRHTFTADGEWHKLVIDARVIRERYPSVKGLRALHLSGSLDAGQSVWIDEFVIGPRSVAH